MQLPFAAEVAQARKLGVRHLLVQALNFVSVLSTALMMWKGLSVLTNCESPIVVVLSGSMEPGIQRGDLLLLSNPQSEPLRTGDITVYNVGAPGSGQIPIVHRVIETHDVDPTPETEQFLLTKGDNNPQDDIGLYNGLRFLKRSHIVGKVKAYIPIVGYMTIAMNDYPKLKYLLLAGLGGTVLLQRD